MHCQTYTPVQVIQLVWDMSNSATKIMQHFVKLKKKYPTYIKSVQLLSVFLTYNDSFVDKI